MLCCDKKRDLSLLLSLAFPRFSGENRQLRAQKRTEIECFQVCPSNLIKCEHSFPWGSTVSYACAFLLTVCVPSSQHLRAFRGLAADYPILQDYYHPPTVSGPMSVVPPWLVLAGSKGFPEQFEGLIHTDVEPTIYRLARLFYLLSQRV